MGRKFAAAQETFDAALAELRRGEIVEVNWASVCSAAGRSTFWPPFAGLIGGPPTLGQRAALHRALATRGAEGASAGAVALANVDKGPSPFGEPQFWEARAAYIAALWATGDAQRAEAEWSQLCNRASLSPPTPSTNSLAALVKGTSEQMIGIEALTSSKDCQDFETGLPRSCDNI